MILREQRILGIESSGFSVSVGLMNRGVPMGMIFVNDGSPGSEILLATIDQLLSTLKVKKTDLEGICLTLGPGSFTSLRISLAVAESMGLGLDIPVYGVDILHLIAATVPYYSSPVKVIQNAYKGEFYTASYDTSRGVVVELDKIRLVASRELYENFRSGELLLGNGVDRLISEGYDLSSKGISWRMAVDGLVSSLDVVRYFLDTEVKDLSVVPLEPIYVRLSDAEINYKKRFGHD